VVEKKKIDVMFFEAFKEEKALLKSICPEHIHPKFTSQTIQEKGIENVPSTLISIRTQSKIPDEWVNDLEGILARSTGYDHVLNYIKRTGSLAQAGYLPSYCARAVGEQAILLVMSLLRNIKKQVNNFETFNRDGLTGQECQDKKALVVGVGNIGSEIVDIARGLRMKVAGFDINQKVPGLEYADLTSGLAWADIVVCALPLTDETDCMLGYEALKKVKTGAIFVNVGRGEVSPLKDLKRLLDEGVLGGAGLDVYDEEKSIAQHLRDPNKYKETENASIIKELKGRENVIFTPHNAFNTKEALNQKAEQAIESVSLFLMEKRFLYPVPQE